MIRVLPLSLSRTVGARAPSRQAALGLDASFQEKGDIVLLREIESQMHLLQCGNWSAFTAEVDAALRPLQPWDAD